MHKCYALGCSEQIPTNRLMCKEHWSMLPRQYRTAIYKTNGVGKEIEANLNRDKIIAVKNAVNWVSEHVTK